MVQGKAFALLASPGNAGALFAAEPAAFQASSPAIPSGKPIDAKFIHAGFGCSGQNVSPAAIRANANPLAKAGSTCAFGR